MGSKKSALRKQLELFESACREAGLKVTHQRLEVFRELASASDHPTAETLYKRLQQTMPTLSLDTVYRTLTTFEEHDLISRVQTTESHARFEAEMSPHHHAICSKCHKITDFQWDICKTRGLPKAIAKWGKIHNKQITLRGICAECARGENR
jgi:Fur family peroxide stress response transcriptional regulator